MADDIDDLLDEVETKFCTRTPVKKDNSSRRQEDQDGNSDAAGKKKVFDGGGSRRAAATQSKQRISKSGEDDDLNSMIDDIIDGPEPPSALNRQGSQSSVHTRTQSTSQRRCHPVYVGGSDTPMGIGSAVSQRMCDQLRCTSCDFKIVFFDNFEWDSSCDYLFFRNNVPDFKKLSAKLKNGKVAEHTHVNVCGDQSKLHSK